MWLVFTQESVIEQKKYNGIDRDVKWVIIQDGNSAAPDLEQEKIQGFNKE